MMGCRASGSRSARPWASSRSSPEIADLVAKAVSVFEALGARVERVDPGFPDPIDVFSTHWQVGAANLLRNFTPEQRARMDPGLQEMAAQGEAVPLMDYLDAVQRRAELGARMLRFHESFDLLLTPTLPIAAFAAGSERPDPDRQPRWINWAPFSNPFNLTQQPAASVPCGLTAQGLPVGLQIVAPMHADHLVLRPRARSRPPARGRSRTGRAPSLIADLVRRWQPAEREGRISGRPATGRASLA